MSLSAEASAYIQDSGTFAAIEAASDLPTTKARSGHPTLTYNGIRLHSAIMPEAEMRAAQPDLQLALDSMSSRSADAEIVVAIPGAGLGYIVQSVNRICRTMLGARSFRILCIEHYAEVARKALKLRLWEPINCDCKWITTSNVEHSSSKKLNREHIIILRSTPGYRANRKEYDSVISTLTSNPTAERPMRIIIPTPLYGGSYPLAGYCARAVRELGHEVELFDLSAYYPPFKSIEDITPNPRYRRTLQGMMTSLLAEQIVARAAAWNADLVWCVAQTPITAVALKELRELGVHSALWFVEDANVFNYWRELAPHFNAVFTIQRGEFHSELKRLGASNVEYLPCAADTSLFQPLELTDQQRLRFSSPISFLGAGYRNRQLAFARLCLEDLALWGNDWPEDSPARRWVRDGSHRVSPEEAAQIYNATDININLHSSNSHDGVNPNGDFVNPRTFEIAACGAFQLVDRRSELAGLFEVGSEIAVYDSVDELASQLKYYAERPELRREIAERARTRIVRNHTYVHRMKSALDYLECRFPRLADRRRGPNYISSLLQAAEGDEELTAFLSQFESNQEITLDDIVARVHSSGEKLGRAEATFLLMKEFRDWGREKGVIA